MLPVYSPEPHSVYQNFFVENFLKYFPDPFVLSRQTLDIIIQFWFLDFSLTDQILAPAYLEYDSPPRKSSSMLRSYLLSIKFKITSITDGVSKLKECPLYAILNVFLPGDVPGIGTFYDFF